MTEQTTGQPPGMPPGWSIPAEVWVASPVNGYVALPMTWVERHPATPDDVLAIMAAPYDLYDQRGIDYGTLCGKDDPAYQTMRERLDELGLI